MPIMISIVALRKNQTPSHLTTTPKVQISQIAEDSPTGEENSICRKLKQMVPVD